MVKRRADFRLVVLLLETSDRICAAMADILLTTLNARYIHAAFGLRYLLANLQELQEVTELVEFTTRERPIDVAEQILAHEPRIVGIGVYIWNAPQVLELVRVLKRICPQLTIVLGGPEVSHEIEEQELCRLADFVITGEADLGFRDLCRQLLAGEEPPARIIRAAPPAPEDLELPYSLYDAEDVRNRVVYVEASRGCPFRCEFCLSSLDRGVRAFDLDRFLAAMDELHARGLRHFKFVDRTFNLRLDTTTRILEFFLARYAPGLFVHFEMVPDRLPEELRDVIRRFPAGALQFEVGIQTFDVAVSKRISRRQDYAKLADNLTFLREHTGVHVHADLIVGLPGEDLETFGRGFDRLVALGPQEIQVGILKRLRGTPIGRHDEAFEMVYSPQPPYEILCNRDVSFTQMQHMRRFARYWDLVANSGNFLETAPLIWCDGSPFESFSEFTTWLYRASGAVHGIALKRLARFVFEYLTRQKNLPAAEVAPRLLTDYQRPGRPDVPKFLQPHIGEDFEAPTPPAPQGIPARQARHSTG